jgi:hypothetical protein
MSWMRKLRIRKGFVEGVTRIQLLFKGKIEGMTAEIDLFVKQFL